MIVALTGATGFVGQAVLDIALAQGLELRALARSEQAPRAGIEWVRGDLADRKALARLVKGAGAVIHVAGVVNTPDPAGFEAGNVTGTKGLLAAAARAGAERFVFVSSLSAREPGLSAYGASKERAERLVRSSPLDWTIVRPPTIYGPRDKDVFELFRAARWGVVPMPVAGRQSVIHVDDLARLLLALILGGEKVTHQCFEPDDGKRGGWSHYEFARAIGWAMGRRPRVLGLSKLWLERAARLDRRLRGSRAKLTLDRVGYMSHPDWVASAAAAVPPQLWKPRIETRTGLKATARWYREKRWL